MTAKEEIHKLEMLAFQKNLSDEELVFQKRSPEILKRYNEEMLVAIASIPKIAERYSKQTA